MNHPVPSFARRPTAVRVLLVLLLIIPFVAFSQLRFIDGDEGYLLMAARLVAEGKVPYRDFFFPQGPVLPYLYVVLLSPFGITWQSGRLLSAICAAGTSWLLLVAIVRKGGDARAKWLGVFLFATTALAFAWLPIAKTYAPTALFLTASYVATLPAVGEKKATWRAIGLGASAALAVGARLYALALVPLLFFLFWKSLRQNRGRELGVAVGAFIVGCVPWLWVCAQDPDNAMHGLIGYHLQRSGMGLGESLFQKAQVVRTLFGFASYGHPAGLQLVMLASLLVIGMRRGSVHLRDDGGLWLAAVLFIVSLLPTPSHPQYFTLCIPFVIPTVAMSLSASWSEPSRVAKRLIPAALVVYVAFGTFEWARYTTTGKHVVGVDRPNAWTLSASEQMARLLDTYAECGPVLASWPGYLVESKASPLSGMESHFSPHAAVAITSAEERRRRRVVASSELPSMIEAKAASIVVVGNRAKYIFEADPTSVLEASGYRVITTLGGTNVWGLATSACVERKGKAPGPINAKAGDAPPLGEGEDDEEAVVPREPQPSVAHP